MEKMRLQKYLSQSGIASRRKAEELISSRRVSVNGSIVTVLGTQVSGQEEIMVDGKICSIEKKYYFLFNKPARTVTTVSDDRGRRTVLDYFKNIPARLFPVGRLDYNTTGALVITNDGDLSYLMMHPSSELEKTYNVFINKPFDLRDLEDFQKGITLEDGVTSPAKIIVNDSFHITVVIHEGKNREVRRMFEALGYEVVELHRSDIGFLSVGSIPTGTYRILAIEEVERMKSLCQEKRISSKK